MFIPIDNNNRKNYLFHKIDHCLLFEREYTHTQIMLFVWNILELSH